MKIQIDWKGMNYLRELIVNLHVFLLLLLLQWQQIDLQKQTNEGDISNYQTNGEFDLINFEAIHSVQFYSCCPEPYPDITVPFFNAIDNLFSILHVENFDSLQLVCHYDETTTAILRLQSHLALSSHQWHRLVYGSMIS